MSRFLSDFEEKIVFGRRPEPGEPLRWLLHVNPFRNAEDASRFERGLRLAGLSADSDEENAPARTRITDAIKPLFQKEGDFWRLQFAGISLQLLDMKGFHDLAQLMARPHQPIHCLDLAGRSSDAAGADAVVDARARQELTERAKSLQEEIAEAEEHHDSGRAERLSGELDQVVETLSQAFGLAGKPRRLGSAVERARTAVTWRIRSAVRKALNVHPAWGRHLENAVRTGTTCMYAPEKPVNWTL
jgi:hypothetical protein